MIYLELIIFILKIFVLYAAIFISFVSIKVLFAHRRAFKKIPYSFKHGMVIDKDGLLHGTTTPIYHDAKTDLSFYGKTAINKTIGEL
jgi:hypothetical protein